MRKWIDCCIISSSLSRKIIINLEVCQIVERAYTSVDVNGVEQDDAGVEQDDWRTKALATLLFLCNHFTMHLNSVAFLRLSHPKRQRLPWILGLEHSNGNY